MSESGRCTLTAALYTTSFCLPFAIPLQRKAVLRGLRLRSSGVCLAFCYSVIFLRTVLHLLPLARCIDPDCHVVLQLNWVCKVPMPSLRICVHDSPLCRRSMSRAPRPPKRSTTPTSSTFPSTESLPGTPTTPSIPKPLYLCSPFVEAALVKGNFKHIVMLPKYADVMEWVAVNSTCRAWCRLETCC